MRALKDGSEGLGGGGFKPDERCCTDERLCPTTFALNRLTFLDISGNLRSSVPPGHPTAVGSQMKGNHHTIYVGC